MPKKRQRKKRKTTSRRPKKAKKQLPSWMLWTMTVLAGLALIIGFVYQEQTNEADETSSETETATETSQSTIYFIESIGDTARQIATENDLYASVMIAQAILESASGQSTLSQAPYYNFFGIKGDYNGNSVTLQTWEDDGSGNTYTIDAQFRAYSSQAESLQDYANLLQKEIYIGVHKSQTNTYQDATAALTGTYATDTSYGSKLNSLIERYGLTMYDSL